MGTLLNRRRYMGGGGAAPTDYISNGLIFRLDGIEKGDDANAWTELINNVKLTGNATRSSNCYVFNNNSMEGSWLFEANADYTVEICFYSTTANISVFGVSHAVDKYPLYLRRNNKVTWLQNQKTYTVDSTKANITSSFSMNLAIENGAEINSSSKDYWAFSGSTSFIRVGNAYVGGASTTPFIGNLYAIRIYNRQLTKDEMINNQKVDNVRFNLGLTI